MRNNIHSFIQSFSGVMYVCNIKIFKKQKKKEKKLKK